jgi:glycosyltransferase involved in cell wall biosynthesis
MFFGVSGNLAITIARKDSYEVGERSTYRFGAASAASRRQSPAASSFSAVHDIRWFAPNRYCMLPVSRLREAGLRIATEGDESARLVFVADATCAVEAYRYARSRHLPVALYLWDLPPWQVGTGRPNPVLAVRGKLIKVPRLWGSYPERTGYYSRVRFVARRAVAIWAPSAASTAAVRARFGVACDELPFCFDSDRFNVGVGWQKPRGVPAVLAISRLVPYKNHAALIRAAALVSSGPKVHLIGAGPEAANLRLVAAELGVEFTLEERWQSDQQITDAYREASVVVSTSRFEGLGLTPLEGIAIGVPTVASDIPSHREFTAGRARLVPLDNDIALASAIDNALRFDVAAPGDVPRLPVLTIEACAARLLPRFEELLRRGR